MREIRPYGSAGGGTGSTGSPYPDQMGQKLCHMRQSVLWQFAKPLDQTLT